MTVASQAGRHRGPAPFVIPGADLAARIAEIKERDGGDLLIRSDGRHTDDLARHGVLDECRIWPVLKGGRAAVPRGARHRCRTRRQRRLHLGRHGPDLPTDPRLSLARLLSCISRRR
ncbi:hypothetical protein GCM10022221_47170 [Actinocorallia aurea]